MADITLESLIEEQRCRIPQLKFVHDPPGCFGFAYYCYDKADDYQRWLATASRYISINFPNDKDVEEFEKTSKEEMTPIQQQKLLAILEAFSSLPVVIHKKNKEELEQKDKITVNANISNTNSQSQNQEQSSAVNMFLEAIKDDLTGKQVKELKEVIAESAGDKEKARNGIVEKLKSFGSDVASNIVANIITNPSIWQSFI